jgi:CheY-like chemotaxis protein
MDKRLEGKRIAIVEDSITNMAVFFTALRKQGAEVIQENWNTDAVNALKKYLPIDLILMDIMLRNGISGYDIFDQLQKLPEFQNIPVVAISSLDPATEIPKAQAKGFVGFISKPINVRHFPDQLAACLEGEKVWVTGR